MPSWVKSLLEIIVLSVVIIIVYNLLRHYILSKLKPNKWVILSLAAAVFLIPAIIVQAGVKVNQTVMSYVSSGVVVILFLWFLDSSGWGPKNNKKEKKVVIKPKAKPNRVKNKNK